MNFNPVCKDKIDFELQNDRAYSWCVLGATRSGKSTLVSYLNEKYNSKKINVLMTESPNADLYKSGSLKHDCLMAPQWMPSLIRECYKINKGTDNHYNFNFLIDDIIGASRSPTMLKLMTVYRNSNIGCMITGQTTGILAPQAKSNLNFVALGKMNSDMEIENVIRFFLQSWFPTQMRKADKIKIYKLCTEDHKFIMINNLTGEIFITKIKI